MTAAAAWHCLLVSASAGKLALCVSRTYLQMLSMISSGKPSKVEDIVWNLLVKDVRIGIFEDWIKKN